MAVVPKIASGDSHTANQINQPFEVRSAVYDSTNDEIDITVGEGRVDWGRGVTTEFTSAQTVSQSAPATSTTYYVYLQSDGTLTTSTSSAYDGSVMRAMRLGSVTTGSTVDDLTLDDLRGVLPTADEPMYRQPWDIDLTYNADDQLTKAEFKDSTGTIIRTSTLTYNADDTLSSVDDTEAGVTVTKTLSYDADGNLTSVTASRS